MLSRWFTTTFTINRPTQAVDSGGAVTPATSVASTFLGHIYPTDASEVKVADKEEEQIFYKILCATSVDISGKDQVEDDSQVYEVLSTLDRVIGNNPHKEILLRRIL